MPHGILVVAEQMDGKFRKVTYEITSQGRRMADAAGEPLTAAVVGAGVESIATQLASFGADKVLVVDDPGLAEGTPESYAAAIFQVIKANEPKIVLFGATVQGKDLAPRLAARLDAGLAMDCTEIRLEGDRLVAVRPIFGGKVLAEVAVESSPKLAAIRPNVVEIEENLKEGQIEKMDVELPAAQTQLIEKRVEPSGQVDLTEADTVVSGGRGMGGADFSIIEELARSLGGAVGASRSAVDEGWRPHSDQVGQTGKVVTPSLYIACGISGAIQHLAGMASSKYIVAINKDPEAPIFKKADYGIVDDLYKVVPAITAEVKKLKE